MMIQRHQRMVEHLDWHSWLQGWRTTSSRLFTRCDGLPLRMAETIACACGGLFRLDPGRPIVTTGTATVGAGVSCVCARVGAIVYVSIAAAMFSIEVQGAQRVLPVQRWEQNSTFHPHMPPCNICGDTPCHLRVQ